MRYRRRFRRRGYRGRRRFIRRGVSRNRFRRRLGFRS